MDLSPTQYQSESLYFLILDLWCFKKSRTPTIRASGKPHGLITQCRSARRNLTEFEDDPHLYVLKPIKYVGIEVWQIEKDAFEEAEKARRAKEEERLLSLSRSEENNLGKVMKKGICLVGMMGSTSMVLQVPAAMNEGDGGVGVVGPFF
ncbi:Calreticulin-3 [Camellia lanceoleosa]|uniref:Calreticulin-3 n=1 Tax=Camellia lanceoleosa TaxID=1840588 RepID=A0ACC0GK99_9ERIC|nr:Calreticulin-3 [Camellia lanceoleosa]